MIINQVKCENEVFHEDFIPYHHAAIQLANTFEGFYINHVSRLQNTKGDALATLAAMLVLPIDATYDLMVVARCLVCSRHVLETNQVQETSICFEPRDWRFSFIDYVLHDILPDDPKEAASIRRRSLRFYYDPIDPIVKTLYRRS